MISAPLKNRQDPIPIGRVLEHGQRGTRDPVPQHWEARRRCRNQSPKTLCIAPFSNQTQCIILGLNANSRRHAVAPELTVLPFIPYDVVAEPASRLTPPPEFPPHRSHV